jgi:hypothetical protein
VKKHDLRKIVKRNLFDDVEFLFTSRRDEIGVRDEAGDEQAMSDLH